MNELDFTPITIENADSIVEDIVGQLQTEVTDSRETLLSEREERFVPSELTADSLEDALNLPSITQEEATETGEHLTGTSRFLNLEKIRAENNKKVSEIGLVHEQSRLIDAKRDVVTEQVTNTGKLLVGELEKGKLIDQRTLGYALQGVRQMQLNTRDVQLLTLEAEETEALVRRHQVNIEAIQSETQQKMLAAKEKALTAAGIDVDFSQVN